jgi:membrane protease YdiL (CAAX protease family)
MDATADKNQGRLFFNFALLSFAALGLEIPLVLAESLIYGKGPGGFSVGEVITHWSATCVLWGASAFLLLSFAKRKTGLSLFANKKSPSALRWALCFVCLAVAVAVSAVDWNGFKPIEEFRHIGWLRFIFQYIYYIFEVALVLLLVAFGQEAGERWFKHTDIPYGGILAALTWGVIHMLTQGDVMAGLWGMLSALLFGVAYLLTGKNIYISYPLLLLMFTL